MKIAVVNLGTIVSGNWREPFMPGDTIVTDGDRIVCNGATAPNATDRSREAAECVHGCGWITSMTRTTPGLGTKSTVIDTVRI